MQNRVAEAAVGPSALRNQGAPGVVGVARSFLKELDLETFAVVREMDFVRRLDSATVNLCRRFPKGARNWGAARKAVNLFLRDALYNSYLARHFHIDRLEHWLEIPLDQYVAAGLHKDLRGEGLPQWAGIKHVTSDESMAFQQVAKVVARKKGIARIHLDLVYWRGKGGEE
jgi:hypothetical protein